MASLTKKQKKNLYIAGAIILIVGGYYWYKKSTATVAPVQYKTAAAEKGMLLVSVSASGQAEAVNQVDLKSVAAGDAIDVVNVYVKNDQAVKKGTLIVLLDSADAQKSVRNATLNLDSAENKYTQAKRDYKSGAINKLSFEAQKLSLEQSQNSLADAKEKLNDYYIRAPFDGIVTGLSVGAGDSVSRSDILASVITRDVHATVSVNEIDVAQVRVGNKATIKIGALADATLTGKVTKIDTIGQSTQNVVSYAAEISFDQQNDLLKPGMNISASIITNVRQDVITVPNSAVKSQSGTNYVEVLKDGETKPQQVTVQIGAANNIDTEIVSGINAGDTVVTQTINSNTKTTTSTSTSGGGFRMPGLGGGH